MVAEDSLLVRPRPVSPCSGKEPDDGLEAPGRVGRRGMAPGDDHASRSKPRQHNDLGGAGPGDAQSPGSAGHLGAGGELGWVESSQGCLYTSPGLCAEGLRDIDRIPGEHLLQDRVTPALPGGRCGYPCPGGCPLRWRRARGLVGGVMIGASVVDCLAHPQAGGHDMQADTGHGAGAARVLGSGGRQGDRERRPADPDGDRLRHRTRYGVGACGAAAGFDASGR